MVQISAQIGDMHTILTQARGVRWAIITVAGIVGFVAGISHWLIDRT
jgi:hypothetical protein